MQLPAATDAKPAAATAPARGRGLWIGSRRVPPALALFVLSPVIAELCLGSTPPLLFLIPPLLAINLGLYGAGSLLVHELIVRWRKGWPSILALGVAYAIVEEGIALLTMFSEKTGPRVSANLGSYGAGPDGANWVWITGLCVYHAVVSIALPQLLVRLFYPDEYERPWTRGRGLAAVASALAITVVAAHLVVHAGTGADWDNGQQGDSIIAVLLLAILAWRLPAGVSGVFAWLSRGTSGTAAAGPSRVAVTVFAATFLLFFFDLFGKGANIPAGLDVAAIAAIPIGTCLWLARCSTRAGWGDRQRFAIAAGLLSFMVPWGLVMELAGLRFMSIVALLLAVCLRRGWRYFRTQSAPGFGSISPVPSIA